MCRFLAYKGPSMLLADALYRPAHSLIRQSFSSRERADPLNGDGFGVGWYVPDIVHTPCVITSITPAWNNQNLRRLSYHVKSGCFFAHVRAASRGMRVSEANCHPFQHGRYLWMHNGAIREFNRIKRRLRQTLPDRLYNAIEGTTDSEHAFAVFLHVLGDSEREFSTSEIGTALVETVRRLERWTTAAGISAPSYYNFAVTDGHSMAAVRYVSDPMREPQSLYYSAGRKYECSNGVCQLRQCNARESTVIIASERLTPHPDDWVRVAPNHLLTVTPQLTVRVELIDTTAMLRVKTARTREPVPAQSS